MFKFVLLIIQNTVSIQLTNQNGYLENYNNPIENGYFEANKNSSIDYPENNFIKYSPSMFDPLAIKKYPELFSIKGFIKNHQNHRLKKLSSKIYFGNLSISTINARLERDTLENKQINTLASFIDSHHPTLLLLQSLSKDVMDNIESIIDNHYKLSVNNFVDIDRTSMKNEYKPILYDSKILKEIGNGNFSPPFAEQTTTYATFSTFQIINTNHIFTVINVDLYSADAKTIETQLFTIIKHIHESYIDNYPIIIGGTINAKTRAINKLISKAFKNLLKKDKNNTKLSEDTFHDNGNFSDGISRDFILLHDENDLFQINYARILKGFDKESFKHYPIYGILTVKHE